MKIKVRSMMAMVLAIGAATSSMAAGISYTSAGTPGLARYVPGMTTYDQVSADMGNPVQMGTDSQGMPNNALFYVPMQGDASISSNAAGSAATTAVKTGLFSRLSSGVGAVVQRIPGVGGTVAAQATGAATAQASSTLNRPRMVWGCAMYFTHGVYQRGACSTINRPVGT
jgi:hypothetical protein